MGNRINDLHKKAGEIVEKKESLSESSELLSSDLEEIRGLLDEPLQDENDVAAEGYLESAVSSDLSSVESELQENDSDRADALDETDSYIASLEENLAKLQEMRTASDLGCADKSSDSTERRIEELQAIRELLEGEDGNYEPISIPADGLSSDSVIESTFHENISVEVKPTKYDYSLGVLFVNTNLSDEYKRILENRKSSAEQNARTVFSIATQKGMIKVKDASWYDAPHFYPGNDNNRYGIYFNADVDEQDIRGRGSGSTFFHETGHMIDHAFGNGEFLSSSNSFRKALKEDASAIIAKCDASPKWAKSFYKMIQQDDTAHSISDIMEGITYGEISGKYGHMKNKESTYWTIDKYRVCNECFAHFFEASMGGGNVAVNAKGKPISKIERLKILFPNTYREFDRILRYIDINYNSDPRAKERSLPYD